MLRESKALRMQPRHLLITALTLLPLASGLSFLIYSPLLGRSHVNFMARLADVLYDAGHDVTVIEPILDPLDKPNMIQKYTVISVPQAEFVKANIEEHSKQIQASLWRSSLWAMRETGRRFFNLQAQQCNATLDSRSMWKALEGRKFDAAISEIFDMCGFALFEKIGIENTAISLSQMTTEGFAQVTGLPSFPSYVPGPMPPAGVKMTFMERVKNSLPAIFRPVFLGIMSSKMTEVLDEKYGVNGHTPIIDLYAKASMIFVNTDPFLDFPQPTLHKIVEIGGITVSGGPKPLNQTWSDLFNLRPKTVLLSFGTVARSYLMPDDYKAKIRETFRKFPDVTFIWKYEKPEHRISDGIPNIVESTFVPQNDMLHDPRLSLFVTHCGAGSTIEATRAGVPLIVIPVMGDQTRNAQLIPRHEIGVMLQKEDLEESDELEKAVREVLGNPSYRTNAQKLAATLSDRPFDAKEIFLRNAEFLAKYGPLRQLDHYGTHLNFFQYYLIDVFAFLISIVIIVIVVIFFTCRYACRFVYSRVVKSKVE